MIFYHQSKPDVTKLLFQPSIFPKSSVTPETLPIDKNPPTEINHRIKNNYQTMHADGNSYLPNISLSPITKSPLV